MNPEARKYLAAIGRKGGQKSRRTLSKSQARAMVRAREAKKTKRQKLRSARVRTSPNYTDGLK